MAKQVDYKAVGLRIKTLRLKNNIYQTELAKNIGVSQTHMSNIESGRIQDQYMIPYFKDGNYSKGILQGYKATAAKIAQGYNTELSGVKYQAPASQPQKNTGSGLDDLLFALGVIGFLIVDNLLLGGFFTRILLLLIFRGGGRGGGGRGFGGGSGGGGGSSRSW